jgi:hypothetical protein
MKAQEARGRAWELLKQLPFYRCSNNCDRYVRGVAYIIWGLRHGSKFEERDRLGEQLLRFALDGDKLRQLAEMVDTLEKHGATPREVVLIGYLNVLERYRRLPYVHEIQKDIESHSGPNAVPANRTIRWILNEVSLRLNRRGRPKKNRK